MEESFKKSVLVQTAYAEKDNYKIEYNHHAKDKNLCVVYFSSNAIYNPETEQAFNHRINRVDAYEWFGLRIKAAYKHIFVRDILRQWYLKGISRTICTPQLLLDILRRETEGYKVITLGSSAGGYAAILYGTQLNAIKIYAFNPQFDLNYMLTPGSEVSEPYLWEAKGQKEYDDYINITSWIRKSQSPIIYFYSIYSKIDNGQYEFIKDIEGLHVIRIKSDLHGIPFSKDIIQRILDSDMDTISKLVGKAQSPYDISCKISGRFSASMSLVIVRLKRRLRRLRTAFYNLIN